MGPVAPSLVRNESPASGPSILPPKSHSYKLADQATAAIASNLARGDQVPDAVEKACRYVKAGIKTSFNLGHGSGPINHFHSLAMAREPPCESSLRVRDWNLDKELESGR